MSARGREGTTEGDIDRTMVPSRGIELDAQGRATILQQIEPGEPYSFETPPQSSTQPRELSGICGQQGSTKTRLPIAELANISATPPPPAETRRDEASRPQQTSIPTGSRADGAMPPPPPSQTDRFTGRLAGPPPLEPTWEPSCLQRHEIDFHSGQLGLDVPVSAAKAPSASSSTEGSDSLRALIENQMLRLEMNFRSQQQQLLQQLEAIPMQNETYRTAIQSGSVYSETLSKTPTSNQ